jgi:uncharacterized membrane protein YhaH (DUF805 family)
MGRVAYFGFSALSLVTFFALMIAAFANWSGGGGPTALLGLAIAVAAIVINLWTTIALNVKRLHDLDLSGLNLIWVVMLDMSIQGLSQSPDEYGVLALIATVLAIGVKLWLLFAPGTTGENSYGPQP